MGWLNTIDEADCFAESAEAAIDDIANELHWQKNLAARSKSLRN